MNSFQDLIAGLNKSLGAYSGTKYVKTDVLPIDGIFEGKGLPLGKVVELASREGVGKSTTMFNVSRNLCAAGYNVVYIDAERAITDSLLDGVGVSRYLGQTFFLMPVCSYEQISDVFDKILPHKPTMIVLDSITALRPAKIADLNVEDIQPGLCARLQSNFFLKYKDVLATSGTTLVILNQMRVKLNFKGLSTEVPAGGNAMKFYADCRLVVRKSKDIIKPGASGKKEDDTVIGADCIIEPLKNKLCASRKVNITILHGRGVSNTMYLRDLLIGRGYLSQSSSYFKFSTPEVTQNVQGRDGMMALIKEHYEYFLSLVTDLTISSETLYEVADSDKFTTVEEEERANSGE